MNEGAYRAVREDTSAFYVSTDLEFDRIRANVGARYIKTDIESDRLENGVTSTDTHSYDDILPSLNVSYDITDDIIARFAAAKVMRRADYSALSSAFLIDSFATVGSRGDIQIDPYRATQYDMSVERYFGEGGLVSLAVFYKDVESFLTNQTSCVADARTTAQNTTEFGNICLLGVNGGSTDNLAFLTVNDFAAGSPVLATLPTIGSADADAIRARAVLPGYDAGDEGTQYVGQLAANGNTGILTSTQANGEMAAFWVSNLLTNNNSISYQDGGLILVSMETIPMRIVSSQMETRYLIFPSTR